MAETTARRPDGCASRYVPPHRRHENIEKEKEQRALRHENTEKEKERQALRAQAKRLEAERHLVLSRLHHLNKSPEITPQERVIAFIHTVERAHDYFDFKDYLQKHCGADQVDFNRRGVVREFTLLPKKLNMFNTLTPRDINEAALAHTNAVVDRLKGRCLHPRLLFPDLHPDCPENTDSYAFSNPIFGVVFRVRQGVYVMDKYPEKELKRIKDSVKKFNDLFIFSNRSVLEKIYAIASGSVSGAKKAADVTSQFTEACKKYNTLRCPT